MLADQQTISSQMKKPNKVEELYQHYMKTTMKHYVPRKNSRESLINIGSESKFGVYSLGSHINSSFCAAFGGPANSKPEAAYHTD